MKKILLIVTFLLLTLTITLNAESVVEVDYSKITDYLLSETRPCGEGRYLRYYLNLGEYKIIYYPAIGITISNCNESILIFDRGADGIGKNEPSDQASYRNSINAEKEKNDLLVEVISSINYLLEKEIDKSITNSASPNIKIIKVDIDKAGLENYNEIDGEMVLENAFEIIENPEQPSLTGVEPNQAEIGQILNLTISGQFTHFQASSTTVWLQQGTHTIYPGYTVMNSNTQATAHFSFNQYHSTGVYDVKTFNAIDGPLTLYNSFNLLPGNLPAIAAIEPTSGTIGELLGFDIYGENTHFDEASVVLAYLENSNNQIIELLFDNQFQIWTNEQIEGAIIIPYNVSPGMYDLHVFDNIDGSMVLPQAFYVNPNSESPEIFSIDPDSCYANQQVDVQVQTLNTWYTWSNELYVSMKKNNSNERIWAESIDIENNQELLAHFNIPRYSPGGYWDFIVTDNICGELVLEGGMVIIDTITGIDRNIIASTLQIFPNPATETFKVSTPSRLENCKVTIYNLTGQRKEYNQVNFSPNQAVQFDIQNLTRGFYFVQIITNEEIIIKKIIKQ